MERHVLADVVELSQKRRELLIRHGVPVGVVHSEPIEGGNDSLRLDENLQVRFWNWPVGDTLVLADEAALANFADHNLGHVIHKAGCHGLQDAELLHDAVRQRGVHGIVQTPHPLARPLLVIGTGPGALLAGSRFVSLLIRLQVT